MMCSLKKNAVIFQVGNNAKDPIIVIEQKYFTNQEPDSSVPLLGIYNGHHYQSVLPASKEDEELTVDIVNYFPSFQGNFKTFLAHKANHQKMKKTLVSTVVKENSSSEYLIFQSEPTNNVCYVPLGPKDNESTKGHTVTVLQQENPKVKIEVTLSEESSSKNEEQDFQSKQFSKKENEGINRKHDKLAIEQNISENEQKNEGINSTYEKPALD